MLPPVFTLLAASVPVTALVGSAPVRVFPAGQAPEKTPLPYCTWVLVAGIPQNQLGEAPLVDQLPVQIDVWAATYDAALDVAAAVRDTLEPHAHMTNVALPGRDPDTRNYRVTMQFDFFTER